MRDSYFLFLLFLALWVFLFVGSSYAYVVAHEQAHQRIFQEAGLDSSINVNIGIGFSGNTVLTDPQAYTRLPEDRKLMMDQLNAELEIRDYQGRIVMESTFTCALIIIAALFFSREARR